MLGRIGGPGVHRDLPEARILPEDLPSCVLSVPTARILGMNSELPPTLRNLAGNQAGVVSRAQALRAGLTIDMIKFRLKSDRWRLIHPGVYTTFTGIPGRNAQLWAAVLSAGQGAMLSHETAAELHRLTDKPADPIHVTVPWQRRVIAVSGVSLHRCRRADEIVLGHTYPPRTKVEETVLDLRYGWTDVRHQPCGTAAQVAGVLRGRGWQGMPRPCSYGCPVQRLLTAEDR